MRLKLLAAAALGAAITVPACALAATEIESYTIPSTTVPYTDPFQLAAFNPALGTLESVTFQLQDYGTATVLVSNANGGPETFTQAFANIPLSVTGPLGYSVADTISATNISGTVAGGASLAPFPGSPYSNTVTNLYTTGLSAFEGASPLELSYAADAGTGNYGGSSSTFVSFGGTANVGGTFDIIYNYTASAVPEPATWAFMMLGVGAIGAAMRGRRKAGLALAAV